MEREDSVWDEPGPTGDRGIRMAVTRDFSWITKRYPELQRKYPSQYVAVKNGRVISHGREFGKVYDAAIRKAKKEFVTGYILSGEPFVLNSRLQYLPGTRGCYQTRIVNNQSQRSYW